MLRRSHKKSRGGCLECKRRHVKCDEQRPSCRLCTVSERHCSFASQVPPKSLSTSGTSSRSVSSRALSRPDTTPDAPLTPSSLHNAQPLEQPGFNSHHDLSLDEPINLNHMELLAHLTIDKDMFNLGVIEDYYAGLAVGLRTALKSPYFMHQILAYSARHLAFLHPERSEFYSQQAIILQTHAVSLFTAVSITVNQFNCVSVLLFSVILGYHLLADALAKRDPSGLDGFVTNLVQCAQTYSGVYTIAKSAWPLLLDSELGSILSSSADFTSRQPKGNDCQRVSALVDSSTDLSEEEQGGCRLAIQYLQVGLDAALAEDPSDVPLNRYQMISEWTMLVRPEYTRLLTAKQPVALIVLAHYALLLHYGRHLWQVGNTGAYMLRIIGDELGPKWDYWLEYPRAIVAADPD